MHHYERIALWVIVGFLLLAFMVKSSGYTASNPVGIMDLAEFRNMPDDIKQAWQTNVTNLIMPAVGAKVLQFWNTLSAAQKTSIKDAYDSAAAQLVTNINSASITA
jgi:hypothetical protein